MTVFFHFILSEHVKDFLPLRGAFMLGVNVFHVLHPFFVVDCLSCRDQEVNYKCEAYVTL